MSRLFDPASTHYTPTSDAVVARDAAIEQVGDNASADWLAAVWRIVEALPIGALFTTDYVWASLERDAVPPTHEPRAMGAAIVGLRRAGLAVATGDYRKSARVECHARPVMIWRRWSATAQ